MPRRRRGISIASRQRLGRESNHFVVVITPLSEISIATETRADGAFEGRQMSYARNLNQIPTSAKSCRISVSGAASHLWGYASAKRQIIKAARLCYTTPR
jgi:hypothetical protein